MTTNKQEEYIVTIKHKDVSWTPDIDINGDLVRHLYILYKKSGDDTQYIFRGGPKPDNPLGDLYVTNRACSKSQFLLKI